MSKFSGSGFLTFRRERWAGTFPWETLLSGKRFDKVNLLLQNLSSLASGVSSQIPPPAPLQLSLLQPEKKALVKQKDPFLLSEWKWNQH